MSSDLHTRLRSAIEERLALAQAVQEWHPGPWRNRMLSPRYDGMVDRPITAPTRLGYPGLVICAYEWQDGDGYIAIWSKDCPGVRSMAEVWLP